MGFFFFFLVCLFSSLKVAGKVAASKRKGTAAESPLVAAPDVHIPEDRVIRFGLATVNAWNGSSGSGFWFRRFLWGGVWGGALCFIDGLKVLFRFRVGWCKIVLALCAPKSRREREIKKKKKQKNEKVRKKERERERAKERKKGRKREKG